MQESGLYLIYDGCSKIFANDTFSPIYYLKVDNYLSSYLQNIPL